MLKMALKIQIKQKRLPRSAKRFRKRKGNRRLGVETLAIRCQMVVMRDEESQQQEAYSTW